MIPGNKCYVTHHAYSYDEEVYHIEAKTKLNETDAKESGCSMIVCRVWGTKESGRN